MHYFILVVVLIAVFIGAIRIAKEADLEELKREKKVPIAATVAPTDSKTFQPESGTYQRPDETHIRPSEKQVGLELAAEHGIEKAESIRNWASIILLVTAIGAVWLIYTGFSQPAGLAAVGTMESAMGIAAGLVGALQYHLLTGFASLLEITARRSISTRTKP